MVSFMRQDWSAVTRHRFSERRHAGAHPNVRLASTLAPPKSQSLPEISSLAAGLREFELMHNLLCGFAGGAEVGVDQHIGLAIERFAQSEQFADFQPGVGITQ